MCGRFTITVSIDELRDYLKEDYDIDLEERLFDLPRYNVSPGQDVIAIINDGKKNRVGLLRWGFLPSFAKDETLAYSMINAKSETLSEKPSYQEAFKSKRCIILADGFYEWMKDKSDKKPMYIHKKDKSIFPMAGLWNTWTKPDGTKIHTCTIVTTEANDLMKPVHDRMPVILEASSKTLWLNPGEKNISTLSRLLKPYDANAMSLYPVSTLVNTAKNDSPLCIQAVPKTERLV
jgi:putative SOS response-associated peptidase YedK